LDVLLQNQRRPTKSEDRKMQRPAVLTLVVKDQTCSVLSTEETFTLWMLLRICTVHLGTLLSLSLSVLSLSLLPSLSYIVIISVCGIVVFISVVV